MMWASVAVILTIYSFQVGHTLEANENLSCIRDIERFSTGASPNYYYECNGSNNGKPKLVKCPDDQLYQTNKQVCVPREEFAKPEAMDADALGRNFQLGSFYDARINMFFPESSFWTRKTIKDNMSQNNKFETTWDLNSDQRTLSKSSHMDISASLTMDFMSGMIHVSGSAGYLNDKVSNEYEVNVELTYDTTKIKQTLPKYTEKDFGDECENQQYTHVVTGVTYGLSCVFVFKSLTSDSSEQSSVTGDLELAINSIPGFSIEGGGSVNLTESQQETLETTNLRMFGDFSPEHALPSTYDGAVEFYKKLPSMTPHDGDDWSGVTIVSVHMVPITDICDDTDRILNEISNHMMTEVTSMLDKLEQLNMNAGILLGSSPAQKFKPLRENLNLYRKALKSFEIEQARKLQEILPNIRGGDGMGEDALTDLITAYDLSQFEYETSHAFLVDRSREVNSIMSLVKSFGEESNIGLADYENANDVEYIFERDMVIVLEVNILTPTSLTESFLNGEPVNEDDFWFNKYGVTGILGGRLRRYHDFALDNVDQEDRGYLLKISPYDDTTEYTMTAFFKGQLISDQYDVPVSPEFSPTVSQISHNGFKFKIDKQNDFTIGVRVFINNIQEGTVSEQDILFPMDAVTGEDVEVEVEKLELAKVYSFSVKYLTEVGTSPPSPTTAKFNTAPVSSPNHVTSEDVTTNSVKLTWGRPTFYAEGIVEAKIQYKIKVTDEAGQENEVTTADLEYSFDALTDATLYQFEVSAAYNDLDLPGINDINKESAPAIMAVFSSPSPPAMIDPTEIYEHSAIVAWDPPARLGTGVQLVHYVLEYSVSGSEDVKQIVVPENHCELTDLAMGNVYSFAAKIVTNGGKSVFSSLIPFTTKFTQTAMGQFRDEVYGAIGDIVDDIRRETRFCASKASTNDQGVLKYDSVYVNVNVNVEGASLDPSSGIFTAGWAGTYQVVTNMQMVSNGLQQHSVWMEVNGVRVEESKMHSNFDTNDYGIGTDNGSRDIILKLKIGDKISLTHVTDGDGTLNNVNFCVSSVMLE